MIVRVGDSMVVAAMLTVLSLASSALVNPSQSQCAEPEFAKLPFCNVTLSVDARVADLVARMTIDEKISLVGNTNGAVPVPRLGVAALPWGEALHGVVSHCYSPPNQSASVCPTSFPHALASAASFNRTLWRLIGDAISSEARALNNLGVLDDIGTGPNAPLMLWAPNLNPYRDPRWGRGHETPGEDPFLAGEYGVEFILGLQNGKESDEKGKYLKAVSIVKHSFAYDLEGNHETPRGAFNAVASAQEQADYFMPPFEAVVSRAGAGGLMCSYNAVNGIPSCMNAHVNNQIVREQWGMDGVIVSDCGAIGDAASTAFIRQNFSGSVEEQVAQGLRGGCDFNCGKFYQAHLPSALATGQVNQTDLDQAVSRLLKKAFQLGLLDPVSAVPYASYGEEQLNTLENRQLALDAAKQGIVLLKNDAVAKVPLLPLPITAKVALIGPHFNATTDMLSNYHGDNNVVYSHTPLLGMSRRGNVVGYAQGSPLWQPVETGFKDAVAVASKADVAVVFLGLHAQWFDSSPDGDAQEGEGLDRRNITLPEIQLKLLQAVHATGVPIVVVMINGGQVACSWIKQHIPAVIEAWYPGQFGGDAIASIVYGDASPSGRLPYTMYDEDFTSRRPSIGEMSLSASGGITYQYYQGTPLWPFGWGLSYTQFSVNWSSPPNLTTTMQSLANQHQSRSQHWKSHDRLVYNVSLTNVGTFTSDVSILAFLKTESGVTSGMLSPPQRELFDFCRLHAVAPNETRQCSFEVLASVVAHNSVFASGAYSISIEIGDGTHIIGQLLVEGDAVLV